MLKCVVMTYRLYICNMFDEIPVMFSKGPSLFKNICICIHVSMLVFIPEGFMELWAVAQVLALKRWPRNQGCKPRITLKKTLVACIPILGECLEGPSRTHAHIMGATEALGQ